MSAHRSDSDDVLPDAPHRGPGGSVTRASGAVYSGPSGSVLPGPPAPAPDWLTALPEQLRSVEPTWFSRFLPPEGGGRESAVLILFGPPPQGSTDPGPHLLLCERAHTMRSHAAQIAFPGGAAECDDDHVVETALREANEETGLDPAGVEVIEVLPALFLPPSGFVVHPVVGWWREPSPVHVADHREAHDVFTVPVRHLVDPAHRYSVTHPSGFVGPAFDIDHLLLWGFTGGLTSKVLELSGQSREWDLTVQRPLPERYWSR